MEFCHTESFLHSPAAQRLLGFFQKRDATRAARQGASAMAHLTPGESAELFGEIGNMQPSRSSLDRLSKALSPHWEAHRVTWEAQLRQAETVPSAAKVMAISVDGVMSPIRGADQHEKAQQPGKHASGPPG